MADRAAMHVKDKDGAQKVQEERVTEHALDDVNLNSNVSV